jgi:hypothetical protein
MAYEEVQAGSFKNLTKMEVGEYFEGYVQKFTRTTLKVGNQPPKEVTNIIFVDQNGGTTTVGASGNLRYLVQDGKITEGLKTRITRLADKRVGGMNSSQFKVEQDSSDTIENTSFDAIEAADLSSAKKPASKFPSVKEAAEKLAAATTKRA